MKATLRLLIAAAVVVSAQTSFAATNMADPGMKTGTSSLPCKNKTGGTLTSNTQPAATARPSTASGNSAS